MFVILPSIAYGEPPIAIVTKLGARPRRLLRQSRCSLIRVHLRLSAAKMKVTATAAQNPEAPHQSTPVKTLPPPYPRTHTCIPSGTFHLLSLAPRPATAPKSVDIP